MAEPTSVRPWRALLVGSAMSALIAFWGPYNNLVVRGSYLTIDFTTAAAILMLFVTALVLNSLLRRVIPSQSLSAGELSISYVMSAISCSICTMGLTMYLIPILPALQYLASDDVPQDVLERERQWQREQLGEDKPEEIMERILEGKLRKYYQEVCLVEQPFIKDDGMTVSDLITGRIAKLGENIKVRRFARFELGAD